MLILSVGFGLGKLVEGFECYCNLLGPQKGGNSSVNCTYTVFTYDQNNGSMTQSQVPWGGVAAGIYGHNPIANSGTPVDSVLRRLGT